MTQDDRTTVFALVCRLEKESRLCGVFTAKGKAEAVTEWMLKIPTFSGGRFQIIERQVDVLELDI